MQERPEAGSHVATGTDGLEGTRSDGQQQAPLGSDSRGGLSQALAPHDVAGVGSSNGIGAGIGSKDDAAPHVEPADGGSPPRTAAGGNLSQQQQQQNQQQHRHHTPANHLLNFQRYDSRGGMVRAIVLDVVGSMRSHAPCSCTYQPVGDIRPCLRVWSRSSVQLALSSLRMRAFSCGHWRTMPWPCRRLCNAAYEQGYRGGGGGAQRGRRRGASGGRPQPYDRKKFLQARALDFFASCWASERRIDALTAKKSSAEDLSVSATVFAARLKMNS